MILLDNNEKYKLKLEIVEYIDRNCLFRADPAVRYSESQPIGKLTGKRGYKSVSYVYQMRRLTHNPDMLQKCAIYIFDDIFRTLKNNEEYPQFQFCGLETGSIPLISGLQMYAKGLGLSINSFTVRKERKTYGLHNFIEGIPNNTPIMLIDDLVNSGASIRQAWDVVKHELGLTLAKNAYTIIKYPDSALDIAKLNSIVDADLFSTSFNDVKYWLPADCDMSQNKRPDYR